MSVCLPDPTPRGKVWARGWVVGQQLDDGADTHFADTTGNVDDRLRAFHALTVH